MGGKEFKIPTGTQILAGRTTMFPSQIIQLPLSDTASLLYPSGEVAARYPDVSGSPSQAVFEIRPQNEQLQGDTEGYKTVQKVEPIISTEPSPNVQSYGENAVSAPRGTDESAVSRGAALPLFAEGAAAAKAPAGSGLLKSPWTLGFLGVVVLAGSAFILL